MGCVEHSGLIAQLAELASDLHLIGDAAGSSRSSRGRAAAGGGQHEVQAGRRERRRRRRRQRATNSHSNSRASEEWRVSPHEHRGRGRLQELAPVSSGIHLVVLVVAQLGRSPRRLGAPASHAAVAVELVAVVGAVQLLLMLLLVEVRTGAGRRKVLVQGRGWHGEGPAELGLVVVILAQVLLLLLEDFVGRDTANAAGIQEVVGAIADATSKVALLVVWASSAVEGRGCCCGRLRGGGGDPSINELGGYEGDSSVGPGH